MPLAIALRRCVCARLARMDDGVYRQSGNQVIAVLPAIGIG
ncbi:MAG: hypothetical protein RLZZ387_2447 [Chloroflexota bacterium]|jgi:hypothetical protein